jgi:hypothetical protein
MRKVADLAMWFAQTIAISRGGKPDGRSAGRSIYPAEWRALVSRRTGDEVSLTMTAFGIHGNVPRKATRWSIESTAAGDDHFHEVADFRSRIDLGLVSMALGIEMARSEMCRAPRASQTGLRVLEEKHLTGIVGEVLWRVHCQVRPH